MAMQDNDPTRNHPSIFADTTTELSVENLAPAQPNTNQPEVWHTPVYLDDPTLGIETIPEDKVPAALDGLQNRIDAIERTVEDRTQLTDEQEKTLATIETRGNAIVSLFGMDALETAEATDEDIDTVAANGNGHGPTGSDLGEDTQTPSGPRLQPIRRASGESAKPPSVIDDTEPAGTVAAEATDENAWIPPSVLPVNGRSRKAPTIFDEKPNSKETAEATDANEEPVANGEAVVREESVAFEAAERARELEDAKAAYRELAQRQRDAFDPDPKISGQLLKLRSRVAELAS